MIDDYKVSKQIEKLRSIKGIELIEDITPEQIKQTMDTFTDRIVYKILNCNKYQEIIIPSQGSLYIYYKVMERLKAADMSVFKRVIFRFAVKHGKDKNNYPIYKLNELNTTLPKDREVFIIDDIYDKGHSSNAIFDALNDERSADEKLECLDVYSLSRKRSVPNQINNTRLADLGEGTMLVYPDKWLMGTFGMNSGLFDYTNNFEYIDLLIDTLERLNNFPIALIDFKKIFTREEKKIYLDILYHYCDKNIDKTQIYELLLKANAINDPDNKKRFLVEFHQKLMEFEV
jgi:hypoxanthine-guanine phosphoribosyltransferase